MTPTPPSDPLQRYAYLRRRLVQPVTTTDNIVPPFLAVFDHAQELRTALDTAQTIVHEQSARLTEQAQCLAHDRQIEARLLALEQQQRDLAQVVHLLLNPGADEPDPDRAGEY